MKTRSAVLCALLLAACSSNDERDRVTPPATTPDAVQTIGAEGGSFAAADGSATVIVPANAVSGATAFTITTITDAPPLVRGLSAVGKRYELGPAGATFAVPLQMTVTYEQNAMAEGGLEEQTLAVYYVDDANAPVATRVVSRNMADNTALVELSHFSSIQPARLGLREHLNGSNNALTARCGSIIASAGGIEQALIRMEAAQRDALVAEQRAYQQRMLAELEARYEVLSELARVDFIAASLSELTAVIRGAKQWSLDTSGPLAVAVEQSAASTGYVLEAGCQANADCEDLELTTLDECVEGVCWHAVTTPDPTCDYGPSQPMANCDPSQPSSDSCACDYIACAADEVCVPHRFNGNARVCVEDPCAAGRCPGKQVCVPDRSLKVGFRCEAACTPSSCNPQNPHCDAVQGCSCNGVFCGGCCEDEVTCMDPCAGYQCGGGNICTPRCATGGVPICDVFIP